jgi:hypothetical protein
MKVLTIALLSLLFAGCGIEDEPKVKAGETLANGDRRNAIDGYSKIRKMPESASNITYLSNGWYTFELNGECFLLAQHGRNSAMASMECVNNQSAL